MDYTTEHRVDEAQMHEDYLKKETAFRDAAAKLWTEEQNARERVRSNVGLTEEERQEKYMEAYKGLQKRLDSLSDEFGRDVGKSIQQAEQTLFKGRSEHFAQMLAQAASTPDERLEEAFNAARRSGLEDLQQALAHVAYERSPLKESALFRAWAEANPERAAAVERIKGTPGAAQLFDRTARAMRVPKATPGDLVPTAEDERLAAEAEASRNRPRVEFFGPQVRRQVGSRIS